MINDYQEFISEDLFVEQPFIEANPLPERCWDCVEDCGNCDNTLDRFVPTEEAIICYKLRTARTRLYRYAEEVAELEKQLTEIRKADR